MNWNDLLKKYFVETLEFVKSSAPVVKSQANLYIEELIKWEIVFNSVISFSLLLFAGVLMCLARKVYSSKELDDSNRLGVLMTCAMVLLFVLPSSVSFATNAIKAYVAPRVVIMEKLQEGIK